MASRGHGGRQGGTQPIMSMPMPKNIALASTRAVIALGLVIYLFVAFVHVTKTVPARVAQLGITDPGISTVAHKASSTQVLDMPSSPFNAVKAAYKTDPADTAGYSTIWNSPPKKRSSAVLVYDLLPSQKQALAVVAQAKKEF